MFEIIGPGDYQKTMQEVYLMSLQKPTSSQIISILDKALENSENDLYKKVLDIFINKYLWTCTEHIFLPEDGVIIYDNLIGKILPFNKLKKFVEKDKNFRFVPFGFKTGNMSLEDFLSNPLVINHFKEDSMKIVEKIAKHFKGEPYASALCYPKQSERKFCAILIDKNTKSFALHGAGLGIGKEGYSLGITK